MHDDNAADVAICYTTQQPTTETTCPRGLDECEGEECEEYQIAYSGVRSMDNEGRWIKVTNFYTGKRVAINLNYVVSVRENHDAQEIYNGKRSMIDLTDGSYFSCYETFDEIGAMIK